MPTELRKIININADYCNKELETIKMNQSKIGNSISKVESNLEAINSQLNDTEKQISDLEDRTMEIPNQNSRQKDK